MSQGRCIGRTTGRKKEFNTAGCRRHQWKFIYLKVTSKGKVKKREPLLLKLSRVRVSTKTSAERTKAKLELSLSGFLTFMML